MYLVVTIEMGDILHLNSVYKLHLPYDVGLDEGSYSEMSW